MTYPIDITCALRGTVSGVGTNNLSYINMSTHIVTRPMKSLTNMNTSRIMVLMTIQATWAKPSIMRSYIDCRPRQSASVMPSGRNSR